MTKENLDAVNKALSDNPELKLEKDQWNYSIDSMENRALLIRDLFSGPLDAAMRGIVFPTGHAKIIADLQDNMDFLGCWLSKDQFVDNQIAEKDKLVHELQEVIQAFQPLVDNLRSDDIGASKGFKCIYDHRDAFDKVVKEKLDPFIARARASFIERVTQ